MAIVIPAPNIIARNLFIAFCLLPKMLFADILKSKPFPKGAFYEKETAAKKMDYKVMLNGNEYGLPIVEIKEGLSIAVFDMLSSEKLSNDACDALYSKICESDIDTAKIDTVISAETKGVILAYNLANKLGANMVILRKEHKIYHKDVTRGAVNTFTTKDEHFLHLDNNQIPKLKGKNVLILDDVVSTGSSLTAIESILAQVGANIIGKAFVFAEGDAANREDIVYVEALPLL